MRAAQRRRGRLPLGTRRRRDGGLQAQSFQGMLGPGRPPARPPSRSLQALLLALALGLSAFTLLRPISPHDEGLMLQAGARIAGGQWPYRDFWTNYPPGQPLVLAGLDRAFGVSLLSWRILRVALDAVVSLLAYRLARREAPERYAVLAWVAAAGAMAFPTGPGPNPPALALALGALLLARRAPRAAGVLAGLTILFRLELGLAAAAGVVLAAPRGRRAAGGGVALGVGALALAPFFAVDPGAMVSDTIGFLGIQHLQHLPFPLAFHGPLRPSKLIEFYMPLILVAGIVVWLLAAGLSLVQAGAGSSRTGRRRSGQAGGGAQLDLAGLALVPLMLVGAGYLLGRTDEFHLVPLTVVLAVLLAAAAARERHGALRVALLAALALAALHGLDRGAGQALHPPALADVPGPAGDGVKTSRSDARALTGLLADVRGLTSPGEPIFVADPRHDLVRVGDPLLYVVLDRPDVTRYDVMQPGVVTTARVQREIVHTLERAHTRVVVRWLDPTASLAEPNGAGRSSGVHILDRYLAADFREQGRFGYYAVLQRVTNGAATGSAQG